jgi:hypothetical protein
LGVLTVSHLLARAAFRARRFTCILQRYHRAALPGDFGKPAIRRSPLRRKFQIEESRCLRKWLPSTRRDGMDDQRLLRITVIVTCAGPEWRAAPDRGDASVNSRKASACNAGVPAKHAAGIPEMSVRDRPGR